MVDDKFHKKSKIYKNFAMAYISLICLPLLVLLFSLIQGGGWKPVLTGSAIYITFFCGITCKFFKELREFNRKKSDVMRENDEL